LAVNDKTLARRQVMTLKTLQTMKPKTTGNHPDFFRSQLSRIINLSHPLCRLADKTNWDRLEGEIDQVYGMEIAAGNRPYRRVY